MKIVKWFEDWVVVASFMVIVVVTFVNVVSRYTFQASLAFSEEITINLLVVLTMMGAVVGIRLGAHLGFTYIVENAKPKMRRTLIIIGSSLIIIFLAVLLVWGTEMMINQAIRGRATPSLGIPQWLFTLSIPLAGLLGIVRSVQAARASLHEDTSAEAVAERMAQEAAPVIDDSELSGAPHNSGDAHTSETRGGRK
ncbi:TRAP transporter small permease [Brevibacterium marinum]|uniref:TRAP-type C4-dicarboxylate transport system permease small subunit n=1 Tax=Brevibacterium marinum TaxID=418643 RepID=A0A846RZN1_9MICO|nr:TRAP transporter small permease [Brevibacterium marinum]NJC55421.1 TRAP-type C4-dicarboxylate transport system permease small subunit [Brevibacterium marinum]